MKNSIWARKSMPEVKLGMVVRTDHEVRTYMISRLAAISTDDKLKFVSVGSIPGVIHPYDSDTFNKASVIWNNLSDYFANKPLWGKNPLPNLKPGNIIKTEDGCFCYVAPNTFVDFSGNECVNSIHGDIICIWKNVFDFIRDQS